MKVALFIIVQALVYLILSSSSNIFSKTAPSLRATSFQTVRSVSIRRIMAALSDLPAGGETSPSIKGSRSLQRQDSLLIYDAYFIYLKLSELWLPSVSISDRPASTYLRSCPRARMHSGLYASHVTIWILELIHASLPADAKATNLDSIVKLAMQVFFLESHQITPPPSKNTQLLVEELSSVLLIQLASVYPSRTERYQLGFIARFRSASVGIRARLVSWMVTNLEDSKTHIVGEVWSGEYMDHGGALIYKNREGSKHEGRRIRLTIGNFGGNCASNQSPFNNGRIGEWEEKKTEDRVSTTKIFCLKILINNSVCSLIIDGCSINNLVLRKLVDFVKLPMEICPIEGYQVCRVPVTIEKSYKVKVLCIVDDIDECHILLGRPWRCEIDGKYDVKQNLYLFSWEGKRIDMVPPKVTPQLRKSEVKVEENIMKAEYGRGVKNYEGFQVDVERKSIEDKVRREKEFEVDEALDIENSRVSSFQVRGIHVDETKVNAVQDWSSPKTFPDVKNNKMADAFQEEYELQCVEPLYEEEEQVTYVGQRTLCSPKVSDSSQRNKIFQTKYLVKEKICSIIDEESYKNLASKALVKDFKIPTEPRHSPYQIRWIKKGLTLKVTTICKVHLAIGKHYNELVICDVIDIEACHVLLGRPCQHDMDATHQGKSNMYLFRWSRKTIAMLYLSVISPKMKLENKTLETLVASPKDFQAERKEMGVSYALVMKGVNDVIENAIPVVIKPLLAEFVKIVTYDTLDALPPLRNIQHQIDLSGKTTLLVSISNEVLGFNSIKELYVSDEDFHNT
ncbi:hypothetical protein Tco_1237355 [Tanacetum coccineum]